METLGAAQLAKEIPAERAVATIVPLEEITAVLQDPDSEPELYLRMTGDGLDEDDGNVIAMTWSRDDLELLLGGAPGDDIALTFDRDELAGALFADVEAHGVRERATVFAVVAAGALGTGAAIANAMPSGEEGGPVVAQVAPAAGADSMVSDAASGSGYAAPAADSSAGSMRTDASLSGGYGPGMTPDSSGGGMLSIHEPSTTDGLLVGGVLLAIAGATFASRRHSGASRPV